MVTTKRRRIDWSPFETQKVVTAAIAAMRSECVTIPITRLSTLLEYIKRGQEVLSLERQRPFHYTHAISDRLLTEFVERGIFSRRGSDDPRDARIQELEQNIATNLMNITSLETQLQSARSRLAQLEARPSPQDYLKNLIKELVKEALREIEDERKPAFMRPIPVAKPQVERPIEAPKPSTKPHVTVVGGNRDKDYARMSEELGDKFDLTFIAKPKDVQHLRGAEHVFLWTRWASHDLQKTLKNNRVKFTYFKGSLSALIDFIRETVHE